MAEKIKNPFIHSHDDGCEHGHHDHEPFEPTDPAQKSLADAMRVSFMILKAIMFLMLVFYACTGIFTVEPQQKVVRLQFGKIIGEGDGKVYEQGWYVGWPYPIEEKVEVPTTQRSVALRKAFWYEAGQTDGSGQVRGGPLNPEKDGSLLTGDANIVHGRFEVYYTINDVISFVENVGMPRPGDMSAADTLVTNVAEQGIVYAAAQVNADDFIKGVLNRSAATKRMQSVLDSMGAGIRIESLVVADSEAPLLVKPAYNLVTNAESERGQKLSAARQQRTNLLNEAAGEAHGPLFKLVQEYELAQSAGDTETAEQLADVIDTAFDQLRLPPELGGTQIGGEASRLISEANTYRTETVEKVKSEANSFRTLLEKYREAPQLFASREREQAREAIFTGDVETIYNNGGQFYLEINTDPSLAREREQKRLQEAEGYVGQ
jgi:modulator of FtsH protease HflK